MDANIESWQNLKDNLAERRLSITDLPLVIQWNKRDVEGAVATDEMNAAINDIGARTFEGVATEGTGVLDTLKAVCALVCKQLNARTRTVSASMSPTPATVAAAVATETPAAPAPAAATAPAPQAPAAAPATPAPEPPRPSSARTMQFVSRRRAVDADSGVVAATVTDSKAPERKPAPARRHAHRPAQPDFNARSESSSSTWIQLLIAAIVLGATAGIMYMLFGSGF